MASGAVRVEPAIIGFTAHIANQDKRQDKNWLWECEYKKQKKFFNEIS